MAGSVEPIRDGNGRTIAHRARWRDPDGRQRKKQFRLKRDADQHLNEVESAKARGAYVDITSKVTVAEATWARIESLAYADNTRANRVSQYRTHVEGTRLGRMRLVAVRRSDVQTWVTERAQTLNPATTRLVLGLIRSVFSAAAEDRVIGHNPATGRFFIPAPAVAPAPIVPLTVRQVRELAEAMPERMRGLVLVAAGSGLRASELLGLRLADVDFLRRELFVREQLHRTTRVRVKLKTTTSRRDIPLPVMAVEALAAQLAAWPANAEGFIFTNPAGMPWQYANYNNAVVKAAEKAKLPRTTSHDLRHHYASVLLAAGESVVTVAARLGHGNANLVLSTYGHLMPNSEDRTRRAVDDAWRAPDVPSVDANVL